MVFEFMGMGAMKIFIGDWVFRWFGWWSTTVFLVFSGLIRENEGRGESELERERVKERRERKK